MSECPTCGCDLRLHDPEIQKTLEVFAHGKIAQSNVTNKAANATVFTERKQNEQ